MLDKVNVTAADTEMAMHVHDWPESEARTHLHKRGPQWHKSCAFLNVAVFGFELARSPHTFHFAIDCCF